MYQVIGVQKLLGIYATISAIIATAWFFFQPASDPRHLWTILSGSGTIVGLIASVVGATGLFPVLCRLPGVNRLFPDLDGEWQAELDSNWPTIAQRAQLPAPTSSAPTMAKITIVTRLFFVRVNLRSDSNYLSSKTIAAKIVKDPEDNSVRLYYVFQSTVLKPHETDSAGHEGAAFIDIPGKLKVNELEGVYWTNRNWHKGLNTAGTIKLKRI